MEGEFPDGLDVGFGSDGGEDVFLAEEFDEGGEIFVDTTELQIGRVFLWEGEFNAVVADVANGGVSVGIGPSEESYF